MKKQNKQLNKTYIMKDRKIIVTIFVLLIFVFTSISYSQTDCNCEQALKQLIQKVETEYPGYNEKTKDKLLYNSFKEDLLNKAINTTETNCLDLLLSYKKYFKDGHIDISKVNNSQNNQQNTVIYDKVTIKQNDFQEHILKTTDPFEGIWKSGPYRVGIIKINNEYQGFIIEADTNYWKANEIKFRLFDNGKANYYLRDHSLSEETYELVDGWILYFNNSKYIRELPKPNLSDSEIKSEINEMEGFYFKQVTEKTSLLCISSFENQHIKRIEKLIEDNRNSIESSENLIIDVRNNVGGTDNAYQKLLPYILTNPIRGLNQEFLATQTLIDTYQNWINTTPDDEENLENKKYVKLLLAKCNGRLGEFVNANSTAVYEDTIKLAEHSPKQVVILVNHRTASSGEWFVFNVKQSKKVKILGTPTYGAIDYGSTLSFDFGCNNYKLMMPSWRSMRLPDYPIDNIGFQPDVYLDKSVKDWVKYAVDYLENN